MVQASFTGVTLDQALMAAAAYLGERNRTVFLKRLINYTLDGTPIRNRTVYIGTRTGIDLRPDHNRGPTVLLFSDRKL